MWNVIEDEIRATFEALSGTRMWRRVEITPALVHSGSAGYVYRPLYVYIATVTFYLMLDMNRRRLVQVAKIVFTVCACVCVCVCLTQT